MLPEFTVNRGTLCQTKEAGQERPAQPSPPLGAEQAEMPEEECND